MRFLHWLADEFKAVVAVTLYFAACFIVFMVLKQLLLADYGIEFHGLSTALIGALVTAKVLIVLEKVPLTRWLQGRPAIVDVVVRSIVYTFATLVVLLLEKAFESRAEHGGLVEAVIRVLEHRDIHRVWAATLCVGLAFLAYNAFAVVRRDIGDRRLVDMFIAKSLPTLSIPKE